MTGTSSAGRRFWRNRRHAATSRIDPGYCTAMTTPAGSRIGTLQERPLHAALKRWYARPGDRAEVPVDGFVIDLVRGDLLIEIQTGSVSPMRRKVATLLGHGHRLRIVHPVAVVSWIVRRDDDDAVLGRRRSPRHGGPLDGLVAFVSVAGLLIHPRLEVDLLLIEAEEHRRHTPDGPWRRRGWTIEERRLVEVIDTLAIREAADLGALLPPGLPEPFTTADLAMRLARPVHVAQQVAYTLRQAGVIVAVGKQRRGVEYRVTAATSPPSPGPVARRPRTPRSPTRIP
jgi:hypothetical protein